MEGGSTPAEVDVTPDAKAMDGKKTSEEVGGVKSMMATDAMLDAEDFDAVAYVNKIFPTEQSFSNINEVVGRLKMRSKQLDEDVLDAVRTQAYAGGKGKKNLDEAKRAITELFGKIKEIKRKAHESERMVQDICKDIKSLDCAKRNLTTTITTLNHVHMLVTSMDQLHVAVDEEDWARVALLLQATTALVNNFANNTSTHVDDMRTDLATTSERVKTRIFDEFRSLKSEQYMGDTGHLKNACAVVSALGDATRDELVDWFIKGQLEEYTVIFHEKAEEWGLAFVERRFSWLKRVLRKYEDDYSGIFPDEWKIEEKLCMQFCDITREHLVQVVEEQREDLDVGVFLGVVQQTLDTEDGLAKRFVCEKKVAAAEADSQEEKQRQEQFMPTGSGADAVRAKYLQYQREKKRREEEAANGGFRTIRVEAEQFRGLMSSAFEPFMNHYIAVEDNNLHDMLATIEKEETWVPPTGGESSADDDVLRSSIDLIIYFRKSLTRCSSLTKGQALFDLHKVFKKHLRGYCDMLLRHVPRWTDAVKKDNPNPAVSVKLSENEMHAVCNIISTGIYLQDAVRQMEGVIQRKIDEVFSEHVDFSDEGSEFARLIGRCILVLVLGAATQADPILTSMTKLSWASMEAGSRAPSSYVGEVSSALVAVVPLLRDSLKPAYFRRFCDKFASTFPQRYTTFILKIKRVNEAGFKQLLADCEEFKSMLLELPNINSSSAAPVPTSFQNIVKKEFHRVEGLLKVASIEVAKGDVADTLVDTFENMVAHGTREELQRICEMKGMKNSEVKAVLANFHPAEVAKEDDDDLKEESVRKFDAAHMQSMKSMFQKGVKALRKDTAT